MGFLELLTIIFIVLKLVGVVEWSWWLVLLPEIIAFLIYIAWFIVIIVFTNRTHKNMFKKLDSIRNRRNRK